MRSKTRRMSASSRQQDKPFKAGELFVDPNENTEAGFHLVIRNGYFEVQSAKVNRRDWKVRETYKKTQRVADQFNQKLKLWRNKDREKLKGQLNASGEKVAKLSKENGELKEKLKNPVERVGKRERASRSTLTRKRDQRKSVPEKWMTRSQSRQLEEKNRKSKLQRLDEDKVDSKFPAVSRMESSQMDDEQESESDYEDELAASRSRIRAMQKQQNTVTITID